MRARIGELEDALTSARADLAKEKMLYDKTFKEFDGWIGEVMKKDEAIRKLISERDNLRHRCEQESKAYEAVAKERDQLLNSNLETYTQMQIAVAEMPLLTSIPKPPAVGRWRLIALSGHLVWINDYVFESDATIPLKPGDPAGSGPRN